MSRIVCLVVPLFPLAARLRAEPELGREAAAVVAGEGPTARIVAATRIARRAGVKPGATLAQARALLPKLAARSRDAECERAAAEALCEVAARFSPRVEEGAAGLVFLDADGCAPPNTTGGTASRIGGSDRRFCGVGGRGDENEPERELGRALARAARDEGVPVRVGIASSKLAAEVAAQGAQGDEPAIVAAGRERAFLAPLPLARLAPEIDLAATLGRWGIGSIGDFARLPAAAVASRLGEVGRALHAVARGLDPRPLAPREPPRDFREGTEMEWPLTMLEPFLFLAHAALDRLCRRLDAEGLGCARLAVALTLEPEGHDERTLQLPAPTREAKTLLRWVQLELETRPPGAAVSAFVFVASPDRPRELQLALFGPPALVPDRLATTLARLFTLLGPDRVGSPRTVDGHRPERFALAPFAPPPPLKLTPRPARPPIRLGAQPRGLLAVRALRPALAVEVEVDDDGRPHAVRTPASAANAKRPALHGMVAVAAGPWKLEEGWWSDDPVARDYWDVELAGAGLWRLFRDNASGDWFADGAYD